MKSVPIKSLIHTPPPIEASPLLFVEPEFMSDTVNSRGCVVVNTIGALPLGIEVVPFSDTYVKPPNE